MSAEPKCHRCGRVFESFAGLGQHMRHVRRLLKHGNVARLCPDRRDDDTAREDAMRRVRLKGMLGLGAFA